MTAHQTCHPLLPLPISVPFHVSWEYQLFHANLVLLTLLQKSDIVIYPTLSGSTERRMYYSIFVISTLFWMLQHSNTFWLALAGENASIICVMQVSGQLVGIWSTSSCVWPEKWWHQEGMNKLKTTITRNIYLPTLIIASGKKNICCLCCFWLSGRNMLYFTCCKWF